jgi:hypothetical protein
MDLRHTTSRASRDADDSAPKPARLWFCRPCWSRFRSALVLFLLQTALLRLFILSPHFNLALLFGYLDLGGNLVSARLPHPYHYRIPFLTQIIMLIFETIKVRFTYHWQLANSYTSHDVTGVSSLSLCQRYQISRFTIHKQKTAVSSIGFGSQISLNFQLSGQSSGVERNNELLEAPRPVGGPGWRLHVAVPGCIHIEIIFMCLVMRTTCFFPKSRPFIYE